MYEQKVVSNTDEYLSNGWMIYAVIQANKYQVTQYIIIKPNFIIEPRCELPD